jgi:hypothetical protein
MAGRARLSVGRLVRDIAKEEAAAESTLQAGRLRAAGRHYQRLLRASTLLADLTGDREAVRDLSITYNRCGDFFRLAGEPGQAEQMHRRSLAIISDLAARHPGNVEYRWDVSYTGLKLGDVLSGYAEGFLPDRPDRPLHPGDADRLTQAEKVYAGVRQVLSSLASEAPANWRYQYDLVIAGGRLGFLDIRRSAWDDAVRRFTHDQELLRDLVSRARGGMTGGGEGPRLIWKGREVKVIVGASWMARRALASTSQWLGCTAQLAGQADVAHRHFADFLAGVEALFAEESPSLRLRDPLRIPAMVALRDISIARERLGDLAAQAGDTGQARLHYQEGLAALERMPDRLSTEMRQLRSKLAAIAG